MNGQSVIGWRTECGKWREGKACLDAEAYVQMAGRLPMATINCAVRASGMDTMLFVDVNLAFGS